MNKNDLINKVKLLEGISQDERAYLINLLNTKKKYGLVWEDKIEDVEELLRDNLPVLQEVKEKAIVNGEECPNHILIEGDNLHALTTLAFTHEGMIDVIYIDPPYNTGENDFKYNDKYVDKEDDFRHSKWLAFMSKRLKIMKRLMSEKGVAIIHIDENEFDVLSLLLETEIFSEKDSLGYIIWNKKNPKGDAKAVANMHEYILCFAKNKAMFLEQANTLERQKPNASEMLRKAKTLFNKLGKKSVPDDIREVVKPFNYPSSIMKDFEVVYDLELINREFQAWLDRQSEFSEGEKAYKFIDENGDVFQTVSMAWPNKEEAPEDYFIPLIHPVNKMPCPLPERGWRNPSMTMKRLLGEKEPVFLPGGMVVKGEITFTVKKNNENNQPRRKYLLKNNLQENTPSILNFGSSDDAFFTNIGLDFPYAKPVDVAKYLLTSVHPNPKIILDFFAGSGTTLHAVLELNQDDKKRQCILVTNNEVDEKTEKILLKKNIKKEEPEFDKHGICKKVTYPRLSNLINGYTSLKGSNVAGFSGNNLRYYECKQSKFIGRDTTLKNKRFVTQFATDLLCIKEDCYQDVSDKFGFKNEMWIRIFMCSQVQFLVIFDDARIEDSIDIIKQVNARKKNAQPVKVYVFSNGQYPYIEDFEEVIDLITLCALPDSIYKAYQNVLPKRQRKYIPVADDETNGEAPELFPNSINKD